MNYKEPQIDQPDDSNNKVFAHQEYLGVFTEDILANTSAKSISVYRTVSSTPISENDQTPLRLRDNYQGKTIPKRYTEEEAARMKADRRFKEACHYGLSCNTTPEAAVEAFMLQYRKLQASGATEEELEAYAQSRGTIVAKFNFTPDAGRITEFHRDHGNIFRYQGVNLEDYRDASFPIIIINYKNPEEQEYPSDEA